MKRFKKQAKGQFVIIAALMIAIMIVSLGALLHVAVTYYKNEPWEEYLTLMGTVELGSRRLVELSIANYTNSPVPDNTILSANLQKWQNNLSKIYPSYGMALNYTTAEGSRNAYGVTLGYSLGLSQSWYIPSAFSAANASFTLNVNSIGLTGYKFTAVAFLNLRIINASIIEKEINVTVKKENLYPVSNLKKENFMVEGQNITKVTQLYDSQHVIVYVIQCSETFSLPAVKVWDARGIQVVARYP